MIVNRCLSPARFIIVSFILCMLFFPAGKKHATSIAAPLDTGKIIATQSEVSIKASRVQKAQDTLQWERDPFALPSFVTAAEKKRSEKERVPLKLLAIIEGAKGRVAIIENEVVGKGDTIAGEKVIEIGKETVTLMQEGSKRVITLKEAR